MLIKGVVRYLRQYKQFNAHKLLQRTVVEYTDGRVLLFDLDLFVTAGRTSHVSVIAKARVYP